MNVPREYRVNAIHSGLASYWKNGIFEGNTSSVLQSNYTPIITHLLSDHWEPVTGLGASYS